MPAEYETRPGWALCYPKKATAADWQADFTGVTVLDCKRYWISIWKKVAASGDQLLSVNLRVKGGEKVITTDDWREFFPPTDEGVRGDQERLVNFVLNRLAEGVPNIWAEGATGVGKSFAAFAIALYCSIEFGWKSRFLVPDIFLEGQYTRDFQRLGMRQLHSSRHYPCPEEGTCDLARLRTDPGADWRARPFDSHTHRCRADLHPGCRVALLVPNQRTLFPSVFPGLDPAIFPTRMSPTLKNLYGTFGQNTVFLPIPLGSKNPGGKAGKTPPLPPPKTRNFSNNWKNVSEREVTLGCCSVRHRGVLISIDMDRDDLVDALIEINPLLAFTTRTRGRRGCNFFLRVKAGSRYPNSQAVYVLRDKDGNKCGEWRCGGGNKGAQTVIFGVHPEGQNYQIEVDTSPVAQEVIFDSDLKWFYPFDAPGQDKAKVGSAGGTATPNTHTKKGQGSSLPPPATDPQSAYGTALNELGEPFPKTQRGYGINMRLFFARPFGIKRQVIWDIKSQDFYADSPENGAWEILRHETITSFVILDLLNEAAQRGFPDVGTKTTLSVVKSIVEYAKSDAYVSHKDFFARNLRDLPVIHAANGMWRLEKDDSLTGFLPAA